MKNPLIKIISKEIISQKWASLTRFKLEYTDDKVSEIVNREVYERGNGVVVLLYDNYSKNIILTRQFRLPTYLSGNDTGMLIEACAGTFKEEDPLEAIIRETYEETGYQLTSAVKIFEAYMSPGSVTEIIHFYIAPYNPEMKVNEGGGLDSESEYIQVLELPFSKAYEMIQSGEIIDAKTIMLLQYAKLNLNLV